MGGLRLRWRGSRARARRPGAAAGPAPVLLEERQVGAGRAPQRPGRAGLLGEPRLPQLRRSVARAALLGRLRVSSAGDLAHANEGAEPPCGRWNRPSVTTMRWLVATVAETVPETARAVTLRLDVPDWPGHRPGQHVDVRLTADDGYSAQRSYSLASPPGADRLELTVERIDDGEVSPYLTSVADVGDQF